MATKKSPAKKKVATKVVKKAPVKKVVKKVAGKKPATKKTAKKLERLDAFDEEGLKPVGDKDLKGFADRQGNVVIACKFEGVSSFHDGLALVNLDQNRSGFIDRSGKYVVEPDDRYEYEHFSEGLCQVKERKRSGASCGFIDKAGKLLIPLSFPDLENFHEGLAAAGWAVSDKQIRQIKLPFQYTVHGSSLTFPVKYND